LVNRSLNAAGRATDVKTSTFAGLFDSRARPQAAAAPKCGTFDQPAPAAA
jgi:hypothetical protein